jgi:hypothetical protein
MRQQQPETLVTVHSEVLKCNVKCRKINHVLYADWDTSKEWLPEQFLTGQLSFEPINPQRLNMIRYSKFVDTATKITFGILQPIHDSEGNPILRKIQLTGADTFDMTDEASRIKAVILMHQKFIEHGPLGTTGPSSWVTMTSIEQKSKQNRARREKFKIALDIINKLASEELRSFARLLIFVDSKMISDVIKDNLEEFAYNDPDRFLAEWRNSDRALKELFERAKNFGILTYRQDLGWVFNDNPLGYNDIEVMSLLKSRPELMGGISRASIEAEKSTIDRRQQDLPEEVQKLVKDLAPLDKGDRSISDTHKIQTAQEQNPDVDIMKQMESFGEMMMKKMEALVDEKLQLKSTEDLEEATNPFDQIENQEKSQRIQDLIDEKIRQLELGLLEGKDKVDWKYQTLKTYCTSKIPKEEYGKKINKPKDELFDFIVNWRIEQLNLGILDIDDSSGDDSIV